MEFAQSIDLLNAIEAAKIDKKSARAANRSVLSNLFAVSIIQRGPHDEAAFSARMPARRSCAAALGVSHPRRSPAAAASAETIKVDLHAKGEPFPHFWEQMFGSGRAISSLRESYRRDLRKVKSRHRFQYVRFHAIFDDEVGVVRGRCAGPAGLQLVVCRSNLRRLTRETASARSSN